MSDNLCELFQAARPQDAATTFLETPDGRRLTYGELDQKTAQFANALRQQGVAVGDRVAAQAEKSPEVVLLYLACLRLGAVYLPLNTAYTLAELDFFFGDAEPSAIVCAPAKAGEISALEAAEGAAVLTLDADGGGTLVEAAQAAPDRFDTVARDTADLAAIVYTSGTTGRSKGAMITHGNLAANGTTLREAWDFTAADALLHALPLYHVHGLFVGLNPILLAGARLIFLPKFDPDAVIAHLPRATTMMGVPTFYTRLLAHPDFTAERARNVRLFISGSAPLLEETFHAFAERTGKRILERFGMTETGMNASNPLLGERRPGTVGPALPGVELRVADDQERILGPDEIGGLEVRGANVFKGYWRLPERTRAEFRSDGFFITGDVAQIDGDGYVTIVGRAKDLIISGGLNVYPKEVEAVIDRVPGVAESAVVGLPHPDLGEAVVAIVRRSEDQPPVDATAVVAAVRQVLAG